MSRRVVFRSRRMSAKAVAAALRSLADLKQVVPSAPAHAQEHSLEVQLPFLQAVLEKFAVVPLAVGEASAEDVAEVLDRLWGGPETLVVVSSDLSHYRPYAAARQIDRGTAAAILALDSSLDHEQACGATPVNGLLLAARRRGLRIELLDLRNSGDTAGDRSRVVGYAAFAFDAPEEDVLGKALLGRARNAIAGELGLPGVAAPALSTLSAFASSAASRYVAGARDSMNALLFSSISLTMKPPSSRSARRRVSC